MHSIEAHTPLIPALGKQRQVDLCEFEVSLVYKGNPGQPGLLYREILPGKTKAYMHIHKHTLIPKQQIKSPKLSPSHHVAMHENFELMALSVLFDYQCTEVLVLFSFWSHCWPVEPHSVGPLSTYGTQNSLAATCCLQWLCSGLILYYTKELGSFAWNLAPGNHSMAIGVLIVTR